MNRYFKSFILTIFLYISIIAAVIYSTNETIETKSAKKSSNRVKVTILAPAPPQKKSQKHIVKNKKPKKKVIKPKHKPKPKKKIIKKKPKKKPKPKKVIKKKTEPKEIKEEKVVKKEIKPKKAQKFIPKKQIRQTISKSKVGVNNKDEKLKQLKKQKYFELVKQTIYKNKIYPRSAIRRGVQGVVKVEFLLDKNGNLLKIIQIKGKNIFKNSTKNAILKSFPLAPPKDIFKKHIRLTIKIKYTILSH